MKSSEGLHFVFPLSLELLLELLEAKTCDLKARLEIEEADTKLRFETKPKMTMKNLKHIDEAWKNRFGCARLLLSWFVKGREKKRLWKLFKVFQFMTSIRRIRI
jgi:hypothetical protein